MVTHTFRILMFRTLLYFWQNVYVKEKNTEFNCFMLLYAILDSEYYKSQALRNAKEAYQIHQEKVS